MKSFTKVEIAWIVDTLEKSAEQSKKLSTLEAATEAERALYSLRAEQLTITAEKLREAVNAGNKRIEIKY